MEGYRYYYSTLSKAERQAYDIMKEGISKMKSEFSVPPLSYQRLSDIHTFIKLDNPLIFNTDAVRMAKISDFEKIRVMPRYTMKKKEYADTLSAVEKRLNRILANIPSCDVFEKEIFIHDFIIKNVVYDKLKKRYSHEVTGPLCHGIGVCEGMSKLFKLMCDAVGIDCICVVGFAGSVGGELKNTERHMWNSVKINGSFFSVDVTFDNSLSKNGIIRYDYLNVTDEIMKQSHSNTVYPVPPSVTEGFDYYSKNGAAFGVENVSEAVKAAFKKPYISVFRCTLNDSDILKDKIEKAIESDKRHGKFQGFSIRRTGEGVVELRLKTKNSN